MRAAPVLEVGVLQARAEEYAQMLAAGLDAEGDEARLEVEGRVLLVLKKPPKAPPQPRACRLGVASLPSVISRRPATWPAAVANQLVDPDGHELHVFEEKPPTRDQVIEVLKDIREAESHFNDIQARYRLLGSTWLLASLGAIGTLATTGLPSPSPMSWPLILGVGFVASVGTGILAILDAGLYHRLLLAHFDAGLDLERRYLWLPRIRRRMTSGARAAAILYYASLAFVQLGAALVVLWRLPFGTPPAVLRFLLGITLGVLLLMGVAGFRWVRRRRSNSRARP